MGDEGSWILSQLVPNLIVILASFSSTGMGSLTVKGKESIQGASCLSQPSVPDFLACMRSRDFL